MIREWVRVDRTMKGRRVKVTLWRDGMSSTSTLLVHGITSVGQAVAEARKDALAQIKEMGA